MSVKKKFTYIIFYKPYGLLTQFTDNSGRKTLADYIKTKSDVYPLGRLDMDSEGLLLLTNDKSLVDYLLNPSNKTEKEYFAQVEGIPGDEALNKLRNGIVIENKMTLPAKLKIIEPQNIPPRDPPIRYRKNIPTTWLSIKIVEGRNRQVRKMTAAAGHPTLRLIRVKVKNLSITGLQPGKFRHLNSEEISDLKK